MSLKLSRQGLYFAIWRWHFYAGLYVFLFLVMLALTGLIMLASGPVEEVQYADRYFVEPEENTLPVSVQLESVKASYPHADVVMYASPHGADRSSQFSVLPHGAMMGGHQEHWELPTISVFVNPYTGEVLGSLDPNSTLYNWALEIHGTFFMGTIGDYMIEIAAGFAVLLTLSGLFMWWPRDGKRLKDALTVSGGLGRGRAMWRNLHMLIGSWTSLVLLFFLLSGLTWTLVWGAQFTQAFNSVPSEAFTGPLSAETHDSLNVQGHHDVPWAVEQTPLPSSGSLAGAPGVNPAVDIDTVTAFASSTGFTNYRLSIPTEESEVWTIASVTQSGDIKDPRKDRIVHIDQRTGNILGDISFGEYSLLGKIMATSIPIHQGDLGIVNLLANMVFCLAFLLLAISGVVMWWLRKPTRELRLQPPPFPQDKQSRRAVFVSMLVTSFLFPLAAATLVTLLVADYLLLSRVGFLRTALK